MRQRGVDKAREPSEFEFFLWDHPWIVPILSGVVDYVKAGWSLLPSTAETSVVWIFSYRHNYKVDLHCELVIKHRQKKRWIRNKRPPARALRTYCTTSKFNSNLFHGFRAHARTSLRSTPDARQPQRCNLNWPSPNAAIWRYTSWGGCVVDHEWSWLKVAVKRRVHVYLGFTYIRLCHQIWKVEPYLYWWRRRWLVVVPGINIDILGLDTKSLNFDGSSALPSTGRLNFFRLGNDVDWKSEFVEY